MSSGVVERLRRMRALDVLLALERRHSITEGEWLTWREAWRIDLYAIRCWGATYTRVAYEVKVSRSDFLSELRKPEKRAGALEISHQFFFATPKDLVRADEVPPECGLVYVSKSGTTRVVKRAPLRTPRPFMLSEMVYLCRVPLFRQGILEMRRMMRAAETHTEWVQERNDDLSGRLRRAEERLREFGGHLVVKGSLWRGRWSPRSWAAAEDGVEMYVEEVRAFDGGSPILTLRRLDNGEVWRYAHVEDVLTNFVPLDAKAVAC